MLFLAGICVTPQGDIMFKVRATQLSKNFMGVLLNLGVVLLLQAAYWVYIGT